MYYKRTAELLLQIQCRSRVHYVSICCGKMQKIKIVCIMPNRSWTVGEIRLTEPLKALCQKHSEIECHFTAVFDVSVQDLEGANIVIFQRIATPFAERAAQKLTAMGVPYIYEIDDLLWDVPQGLLSSSAWNRNKERLFFLLKNARAVTTTTPQIAEKLREFNSDVRVIPNVLRLPAKRNFSFDSRAKLILSATDRIYIAPAAEALKKLQLQKICVPRGSRSVNIRSWIWKNTQLSLPLLTMSSDYAPWMIRRFPGVKVPSNTRVILWRGSRCWQAAVNPIPGRSATDTADIWSLRTLRRHGLKRSSSI